jgi:hypothetical protein
MRRLTLFALGMTVLLFASPAFAFQCPKLVNQINSAVSNRFDNAAATARASAAQADALHKAGKHAEAVKAAKDGLAALGIQS